eukprot:TRINITY_DN2677_c0_g1_i1.p1 TRINITY_DN2677_c0_g1~~TRINITY_DN2677_c0_g1_i1.p1  ORF type:complete len:724 (-),score=90.68 TRINITY_DN2677_c0_g1_i1:49-2220(-)
MNQKKIVTYSNINQIQTRTKLCDIPRCKMFAQKTPSRYLALAANIEKIFPAGRLYDDSLHTSLTEKPAFPDAMRNELDFSDSEHIMRLNNASAVSEGMIIFTEMLQEISEDQMQFLTNDCLPPGEEGIQMLRDLQTFFNGSTAVCRELISRIQNIPRSQRRKTLDEALSPQFLILFDKTRSAPPVGNEAEDSLRFLLGVDFSFESIAWDRRMALMINYLDNMFSFLNVEQTVNLCSWIQRKDTAKVEAFGRLISLYAGNSMELLEIHRLFVQSGTGCEPKSFPFKESTDMELEEDDTFVSENDFFTSLFTDVSANSEANLQGFCDELLSSDRPVLNLDFQPIDHSADTADNPIFAQLLRGSSAESHQLAFEFPKPDQFEQDPFTTFGMNCDPLLSPVKPPDPASWPLPNTSPGCPPSVGISPSAFFNDSSTAIPQFCIPQQQEPRQCKTEASAQTLQTDLGRGTSTKRKTGECFSMFNTKPPPKRLRRTPVGLKLVRDIPEKVVYRKILRPFPSVMLTDVSSGFVPGQYFVKAVLVHLNGTELPDSLEGDYTARFGRGGTIAMFDKLKIKHTCNSMKVDSFQLKFSLHRLEDCTRVLSSRGSDLALCSVLSEKVRVFSHSTYLKRKDKNFARISELRPNSGKASGGQRVAITGSGFGSQQSPPRIKFGKSEIQATLRQDGVLLCIVPPFLTAANEGQSRSVLVSIANHGQPFASSDVFFHYVP